MDRAQKRQLVSTLNEEWKDTGVMVVAHYKGMTVAQMTEFRKRMKEAGGSVKVAKNRLAKLALKDTDAQGIADLLKGQTCVAYSEDPVSAAKVSVKYSRENDKLVILGGAMGKTVMDVDAVKALADLPSLDELQSQADRPGAGAGDQDRAHPQGAGRHAGARAPGARSQDRLRPNTNRSRPARRLRPRETTNTRSSKQGSTSHG